MLARSIPAAAAALLLLVPFIDASPLESRQTTWNPPSNLVTPLTQVWDHETATYPANFRNYGCQLLSLVVLALPDCRDR